MGKRGGVRSSSGQNRNILLRRLESSFKNGNYGTLDEIINRLRSNYPDYARTKQQVLARQVQRALEESKHFLNNNNNKHKRNKSHSPSRTLVCAADDDEEEQDDDCQFRSPTPKKLKKIDESEQRLLYREAQHLRRRHVEQERPSTGTTSSSSSSSSDDETDGAVSTSEDPIYGERLEPGFDLMRSMLRSSYSKAKPAVESKPEEKNLGMEEVAQKAKKINSVEGERIEGIGTDSKPEVKGSGVGGNGVGGGGEVKGMDEPMFRDLGGMGGVVEELTTVRPPVGILWHGPPGCGKTKLAHAIANETGFPFHRFQLLKWSMVFQVHLKRIFESFSQKLTGLLLQLYLLMRLMQLLQKEKIYRGRWNDA